MRIFATITPAYEAPCREWLVESLNKVEPEAELAIECFKAVKGSADFQSFAFKIHNVQKNRQLVMWVRQHKGEVIFVTDVDIIYLRPFLGILAEEMEDCDMALAREGTDDQGYNIGQMVIRCTDATADFFEDVGRELEQGAWDQEAINRLLRHSPLRHKPLPRCFANTAIWDALPPDLRLDAVSYHATDTSPRDGMSSIELKQAFFNRVREEWAALQFSSG